MLGFFMLTEAHIRRPDFWKLSYVSCAGSNPKSQQPAPKHTNSRLKIVVPVCLPGHYTNPLVAGWDS